jgi:hypothetical protein
MHIQLYAVMCMMNVWPGNPYVKLREVERREVDKRKKERASLP